MLISLKHFTYVMGSHVKQGSFGVTGVKKDIFTKNAIIRPACYIVLRLHSHMLIMLWGQMLIPVWGDFFVLSFCNIFTYLPIFDFDQA